MGLRAIHSMSCSIPWYLLFTARTTTGIYPLIKDSITLSAAELECFPTAYRLAPKLARTVFSMVETPTSNRYAHSTRTWTRIGLNCNSYTLASDYTQLQVLLPGPDGYQQPVL
ncbi:unnamed protein product [Echinostoma caproni]|uniref:Secreted protein n=1 Tax=Echinostoma caproni TaxID=27848 RepID=A0A183B1N1_9TREM|nr:unnamed protein product [Echinostoma caproni]